MRRDGYALLMVLGLALTVGLAAALMSVRMAQEADQSRLEAEKALAQVQLDGRHNELLLRLAGAFREEVRGLLEAQNTRGRFAFGSGGSAPDQSSVSTAMSSLRQALQTRADALLCPQGFRLYFERTACGQPLPDNVRLPDPGYVSGAPRSGGALSVQRYRLPFVAYAQGERGEARQERYLLGAYEFDLGDALPSRYAMLLDNAYDARGNLHLFDGGVVLEGRLHVAGLLGVRDNPWLAGAVTSGSCPALGVDGSCVGDPTPGMAFFSQGFVPQSALLPAPDRPCLGGDCPVWGDGVDLRMSGLSVSGLNLSGWSPALSVNGDADEVALWSQGGGQYLRVCAPGCTNYRVRGNTLERETPPFWRPEVRLPTDGTLPRLGLEVQGQIRRLKAGNAFGIAVADGVSVEIVAWDGIRITSSLAYENSPCTFVGGRSGDQLVPSRCNNLGATGRLAVLSRGGDIRLGYGNGDPSLNLAEDNPRLHGHFLAPKGSIGTENLGASGTRRGTVFLLGALAMGRWQDWGNDQSGWNLSLTYDPRLAERPALVEEPTLKSGVLGVYLRLEGEQQAD
ncbi:hypothetical protein Mesil_3608 (plasmid) [Allomeiothermus silvanus DSM 9946]|uniref:DUF4900 domain-containing protein n=1 Tax=Allomeiothermus silvanus (strain ATCC 700542 / DSM 9946 / NBRC 106475 / NCIMB 13440 / VI-R2) TaxID=526227 RepID=D7BJP2_ALLS1|nr:DUF4900 domain-containing protein [Allomeiothermus silvanus]ADH65398.1 hypothetical protein Mesil_3608 [Allomeiothermus silvanus DSM 9946]